MMLFSPPKLDRKRNERGLTLVEVVIAAALVALIGMGISLFARDVFSLNAIISNGLTSQLDARQVVKKIAAELREASPSSLGAYPIEVASSSEIIFYSDIDNDGLKEKVRYYLSGLILKKDVVKPSGNPLSYSGGTTTSNIINDIRNGTTSIFTYYDKNHAGTSTPLSFPVNLPDVRLVRVNIAVDRDPYRSPVPMYVVTQVSLRNLKDNL